MNSSIAILITVYNRKDKTLECLQRLYNQSNLDNIKIEIYLTEDNCTDGTPEAVHQQFPQVHIIHGNGNLFWNRGMYTAWEKAAKEDFDFYFVGAHPMAGREVSGYDNSLDNLFDNASFICTPAGNTPRYISDALVGLAQEMGFARTVVTTPEHHDEMIAFTSQIAHVLACSYVLSPLAPYHAGYSAGSYRDVSRVARINADMWTELFIDNKEPLVREIDDLVSNLMKFKYCIVNEDANQLCELMKKGNKIKEEIG